MVNNRPSEIMRFLTLFSAALLPLSVISGIYGMNFAHIPGLQSRFGFPLALLGMAVTTLLVLLFFPRKGWLR